MPLFAHSSHCSVPSGMLSPQVCSLVKNANVEHVVNSEGSSIFDTRKIPYNAPVILYV